LTLASLAAQLADCELVDLTLTLDEELPGSWPGTEPYRHEIENYYVPVAADGRHYPSAGPFYACWMTLHEHVATHFDAPAHFTPPPGSGIEGESEFGTVFGDVADVRSLHGPAAVVDALPDESRPGVSPAITEADIRAWEAEHGALEAGEIVLLRTGWDRYYRAGAEGLKYVHRPLVTKDAPGWPAPDAGAIAYLAERGVRAVGTDAPSIAPAQEAVSTHRAGLGRGLLYIEGLASLDRLPVRGAFFLFLPIKVARSSGAPGRAVAWLPPPAG
jgi:kynurenine formamidase